MPVEVLPSLRVHLSEDVLEEYVFGRVAEPALSRVEEHLLACPRCQDSLARVDEYIALMKYGLADLARSAPGSVAVQERRYPLFPIQGKLAFGTVGLAVLLALTTATLMKKPSAGPAEVVLQSLRAGGTGGMARAPAGRMLKLAIDARALIGEGSGEFNLRIVDAAGRTEWQGAVERGPDGMIAVQVGRELARGIYWVRLYTKTGGLLREYGLRIE